jgi:pimeloyl-ACP methyl ester carboxylesterase
MTTQRAVQAVVSLALLSLATLTPSALARPHHRLSHHPPRPNLVISEGSVSVTASRLSGSFAVANVGKAAAGRSTASVGLQLSRRTRTLGSFRIGRLEPGVSTKVAFTLAEPAALTPASYPIRVCADARGAVRESSERDNCRRIGTLTVRKSGTGPTGPTSTVPTIPVTFQTDTPLALQSSQSTYWVDVPDTYDASNQTPTELFVWLHGCGGEGAGDIYTVSPPGDRPYISIAVGGREDDCWNPDTDQNIVLAAISDVEAHFNIDRHEVVLGGYSSGGDLAYRLAFYHSLEFAGVLAENTSPFRDTGSTAAQSLAAAQWKFHVVHLAHTSDAVYPIGPVENEIAQMQAAGFPVQLIEQPGTHYDNPSPGVPGTDADLQTYLLPHLSDGWRSP